MRTALALAGAATPSSAVAIEPVLSAIRRMGLSYSGFVYIGTMFVDRASRVLDIDVRPGNPELLALLGLLESDSPGLLEACAEGCLGTTRAAWREDSHCGAVFALAAGCPEGHRVEPVAISGCERRRDRPLLAGGVALGPDGAFTVPNGRVAAAVAMAGSVAEARSCGTGATILDRQSRSGRRSPGARKGRLIAHRAARVSRAMRVGRSRPRYPVFTSRADLSRSPAVPSVGERRHPSGEDEIAGRSADAAPQVRAAAPAIPAIVGDATSDDRQIALAGARIVLQRGEGLRALGVTGRTRHEAPVAGAVSRHGPFSRMIA